MATRGVGGAARRLASGGVGSSPAVSIKETRVKVLRRMLAERDRKLQHWDGKDASIRAYMEILYPDLRRLDEERKWIRAKIKESRRKA